MPAVIRTATTKQDEQFDIVLAPADRYPFTLECGWRRNGTRQFIELPRTYRTERGARQAAALLAGESLEWKEPATETAPCAESQVGQ
jgi:hypothetical protein